jgi:hypothetical protein
MSICHIVLIKLADMLILQEKEEEQKKNKRRSK